MLTAVTRRFFLLVSAHTHTFLDAVREGEKLFESATRITTDPIQITSWRGPFMRCSLPLFIPKFSNDDELNPLFLWQKMFGFMPKRVRQKLRKERTCWTTHFWWQRKFSLIFQCREDTFSFPVKWKERQRIFFVKKLQTRSLISMPDRVRGSSFDKKYFSTDYVHSPEANVQQEEEKLGMWELDLFLMNFSWAQAMGRKEKEKNEVKWWSGENLCVIFRVIGLMLLIQLI